MADQPKKPSVHFRKRYLAGSPLNTADEKPKPQEPSISAEQRDREVDLISTLLKERGPQRLSPTAREQFNLSRREIAGLLDKPGVAGAVDAVDAKRYRQLAAGNISEAELAMKIAKEAGIEVIDAEDAENTVQIRAYIEDVEKAIIRKALFVGIRLEPKRKIDGDDFDKTMDADQAAQDREIAGSGGGAIGGSVIRGKVRYGKTEGSTFKHAKLDSFEHDGKTRRVRDSADDPDLTGGDVGESDDYSEDSFA